MTEEQISWNKAIEKGKAYVAAMAELRAQQEQSKILTNDQINKAQQELKQKSKAFIIGIDMGKQETNWTVQEQFNNYMNNANKPPIVRNGDKMTRQDAIQKMPMGFENLPAALEALGLIKFENEEKKDNSIANQIGMTFSHARHWGLYDHTLTDIGFAFISDLKSAGYKIVKA